MQVQKKSLKINFIMNSMLTMSSFLFPLITFPYVSRILLPLGTGKVSFATSVISYFSMFSQLGIPVYGIRACAKVRDDKAALSKTFQRAADYQRSHQSHNLFIFSAHLIYSTAPPARKAAFPHCQPDNFTEYNRRRMVVQIP